MGSEDAGRKCPRCGARNKPDAAWCQLCQAPFQDRPSASPPQTQQPQTAPASAATSPRSSSRFRRLAGWPLTLLLVVIFATRVGAALGGDPVEGRVDARGFKFARIDAETGDPIRFDPCSPIHYVINPAGAPDGAIEDFHTAVEMTARATGVRFVYDGSTDEMLDLDRDSYQPERYGDRWAPVLVGWMSELPDTREPGVEGGERIGLGGSTLAKVGGGRGVLVTGVAFFDSDADILPGFGGATWGQVMLHELGHVMGLDHISDETSVMHPEMGLRPAAWGTGDRAGLWELGIGSSCLRAPEPR